MSSCPGRWPQSEKEKETDRVERAETGIEYGREYERAAAEEIEIGTGTGTGAGTGNAVCSSVCPVVGRMLSELELESSNHTPPVLVCLC